MGDCWRRTKCIKALALLLVCVCVCVCRWRNQRLCGGGGGSARPACWPGFLGVGKQNKQVRMRLESAEKKVFLLLVEDLKGVERECLSS